MKTARKIALLINASSGFGRRVLTGIADYGAEHGPWTFFYNPGLTDEIKPTLLREWGADGLIATINSPEMAKTIVSLALPTVDLQGTYELPEVRRVHSNQREIVRLVVEEFLECGLKHFAYCGLSGIRFSEERQKHFVDIVHGFGHEANVFRERNTKLTVDIDAAEMKVWLRRDALLSWIKSLPKPVGVMACNDVRALHLLNVCADQSIRVPDDIAVAGVDNDEIICSLARPQLSSIQSNAHHIGFVAARILHEMIIGQSFDKQSILVNPLHIVRRQSTDFLALADDDVAMAIRFIRRHATLGISVKDIVDKLPLTRITLERKFSKVLGSTPKKEIDRVRIRAAMEMLNSTDDSITDIANRTGFSHVETMCNLFKQATGRSPGEYRRESRA